MLSHRLHSIVHNPTYYYFGGRNFGERSLLLAFINKHQNTISTISPYYIKGCTYLDKDNAMVIYSNICILKLVHNFAITSNAFDTQPLLRENTGVKRQMHLFVVFTIKFQLKSSYYT